MQSTSGMFVFFIFEDTEDSINPL